MGITHVLRGEDLLSSTPRQIALYEALAEHRASPRARPAVRAPALRHGRGQQEAVQARPAGQPRSSTASAASCPRACSTTWRCWAGRSPRTATSSRWTEMVEAFDVDAGQPQPGPLRPQEGRGDQRHAPTGAARRGPDRTDGALPPGRRRAARRGERRAAGAARAGRPAGARADDHARRGRGHARLPVRRRGVVRARPGRRSQAARRDRTRGGQGCARRARGDPDLATPRASTRRSARPWSKGSGSSPATPSARSGLRSRGRRVSPPLFESIELLGRERSLARLASAQQS